MSRHPSFEPGISAPRTGIYAVIHPDHRVVHRVTMLAGNAFPQCRICGKRVRFQLCVRAADETITPYESDLPLLVPFSCEEHSLTLAI